MKKLYQTLILSVVSVLAWAQPAPLPAQLNEATLEYNVLVSGGADANRSVETQSKVVYIKGLQMRSDVEGDDFHQTIIFNKKTSQGTLLREIGSNKFMTPLTQARLAELNKKYQQGKTELVNEQKEILGYQCRKALISYGDGYNSVVWYLPGVKSQITENDFQFGNIPGMVMEYESLNQKTKQTIRFTAIRLSLHPVPQSVFEPSLAGYRLLN